MKFFAFGNLIFVMNDLKSTQNSKNLHVSYVRIGQAVLLLSQGGHSDGKSMGRLAVFFRGVDFNGEDIFRGTLET